MALDATTIRTFAGLQCERAKYSERIIAGDIDIAISMAEVSDPSTHQQVLRRIP